MAKILIVEDNQNSRYLLEKLLQSKGHQVIAADQGEKALNLARQERFDLVVSDIMMPVMNGFRLCWEIKRDQRLRQIPFIFYTATFLEKEDEELAMNLGASHFIIKPMENERFLTLLTQVLNEYEKGSLPVPSAPTAEVESVLKMYENSLTRKLAETVEKLHQERRALQESERKLKEAQEIAQMGHWELNLQTNHLHWSDQLYRLFGLKPQQIEASFELFMANIHPEDQERVYKAFRASLKKRMSCAFDYRLQLQDGTVKNVHERQQTQCDEDGQPVYLAGTVQDITERKRADDELRRHRENLEELIQERTLALEGINQQLSQEIDIRTCMENELKLAKAAADESNQAKSVFLARMSHELRSPLAAILGYSTLMQRKIDPDSPLVHYIETINSSGQHLSALINDVLEFSKIEAGCLELHPVRFDFFHLLEDVNAIVQGQVEEKGLQLLIMKSEDFPHYLLGDEAKIRQILVNLLTNAVKFTDTGTITLRLGCLDRQELMLVLAVEDTGVGIPAEEIEKLFQPFGQTEIGRSKGGTGLGLVISQQYAQLMEGELTVSSEVGQGSVFTCTCRVEKSPVPEFPETVAASRRIVGLPADLPRKTILIADDRQEIRYFIKQILDDIGFVSKEAKDGAEVLSIIEGEPIDLVLMDMQMPVMNGYQAIRRLRARGVGGAMPIIGISASAFQKNRNEILAAGADDFICKPINETELFEKIGRYLGIEYRYAEIGKD